MLHWQISIEKSLLHQLALPTDFNLSGNLLASKNSPGPMKDMTNILAFSKSSIPSLKFKNFIKFAKNLFIAVSDSNTLLLFYYKNSTLNIISKINFSCTESIQYISSSPISLQFTDKSTNSTFTSLNLLVITNQASTLLTNRLKLYTLSFPTDNLSKQRIISCFNNNKFQHPYTIEVFKNNELLLISNGSSIFNIYNIKSIHSRNIKNKNKITPKSNHSNILNFKRKNTIEVKIYNGLLLLVLLYNNQTNVTIKIEVYTLLNFKNNEPINFRNIKIKNKINIVFNSNQAIYLDYFETVNYFLLLKFYSKNLVIYNIEKGFFVTRTYIGEFNSILNYKALIIIDTDATLIGIHEDGINILQLNTKYITRLYNIRTSIEGNKIVVFNKINKQTKEEFNIVILTCMDNYVDKECCKYLIVRKESVIIDTLNFCYNGKLIGKEIMYIDLMKEKLILFMRNGDILESVYKSLKHK